MDALLTTNALLDAMSGRPGEEYPQPPGPAPVPTRLPIRRGRTHPRPPAHRRTPVRRSLTPMPRTGKRTSTATPRP